VLCSSFFLLSVSPLCSLFPPVSLFADAFVESTAEIKGEHKKPLGNLPALVGIHIYALKQLATTKSAWLDGFDAGSIEHLSTVCGIFEQCLQKCGDLQKCETGDQLGKFLQVRSRSTGEAFSCVVGRHFEF